MSSAAPDCRGGTSEHVFRVQRPCLSARTAPAADVVRGKGATTRPLLARPSGARQRAPHQAVQSYLFGQSYRFGSGAEARLGDCFRAAPGVRPALQLHAPELLQRYLSKFKWANLKESAYYNRAVRRSGQGGGRAERMPEAKGVRKEC